MDGHYTGEASVFGCHLDQAPNSTGKLSLSYIENSESYNRSEVKARERQFVADYILSKFRPQSRIRLLSMPSSSWEMENYLRRERPRKIICTALEQSPRVIERNKSKMALIFDNKPIRGRNFTYGTAEFHYYRAIDARWLNMRASDFLTVLKDNYGQSFEQMKAFNEKFCKNNACWLDFTSPICREVEESVRNIGFAMMPGRTNNPFVLTVMYGRDKGITKGLEGRKEYLEFLNPKWKIEKYWSYKGLNGSRMATFCGLFS